MLVLLDTDIVEEAFHSVFTLGTTGGDETALSEAEITDALSTTWNGESSSDPTALSAEDVNEAVETEWNGESSPDPTALSCRGYHRRNAITYNIGINCIHR